MRVVVRGSQIAGDCVNPISRGITSAFEHRSQKKTTQFKTETSNDANEQRTRVKSYSRWKLYFASDLSANR
jgi:hypothetical protein